MYYWKKKKPKTYLRTYLGYSFIHSYLLFFFFAILRPLTHFILEKLNAVWIICIKYYSSKAGFIHAYIIIFWEQISTQNWYEWNRER